MQHETSRGSPALIDVGVKHVTESAGWLTANEAAAYLGLPSRRALYMAIRRGQVPVHRLGRRMRFSVRELDHALRGQDPPQAQR
jgi:excisionase family DNA binding protein